MDPDAVHEPESKHNHQHKRAAVTDERQWHSGYRQHRDRHSHILKDVREDERRDPNYQKHA